jgi:TRAP-type C4-dicarboxylate transport system permease small subunit
MKRLMTVITGGLPRLSAGINRFCWLSAGAFMLAMLAAVGLQVIARYIFFSPPSWTEELARYCMIWAGYLGATVSFYRREDPVLMGRKRVGPGSMSVFFLLVRNIAVVMFMVPIVYWSPVIIRHHMSRETESMELISGYVMLIVPVFAVIILVHVLARVVQALAKRYTDV